LTNGFDAVGRVNGVAGGSLNYASNVAYDPTGPVSGLTLGNGLVEQWTFGTSQKQPTRLVAAATQPDLSYKVNDTWTWGYNGATTNNGNIVSATVYKTDWTGAVPVNASQSFLYDLVNRLTGSSESGVWTRNYGYDAWANGWVTANSGLPLNPFTPVASSNFDGNNRLGIQNSAYNTGGNQTAIGGFGNLYDAENRLLTSTIGGVTTTYSYDGDGRRVSKVTGATQSNYVYDAAGQLAAEYTSAAAQASACGTCYLTGDALGSTRMITDETATRRECHDYLPFGEEIPRTAGCYGTSTSNTLKFTGKERDGESGLDHYEARYLASTQMRWIIADWSAKPEGVPYSDAHDPQTLNLYSYVGNGPLSRRDLDGHQQMQGATPDTVCTEYTASCRTLALRPNAQAKQQASQQQPHAAAALPQNPSGLGPGWQDVTPRRPDGTPYPKAPQRLRGPSGVELEFDPASQNKDPKTWGGKDHWHQVDPGTGKRVGDHLDPGQPIPGPIPQSSIWDDMKSFAPAPIAKASAATVIIYFIVSEGSRAFPPRNLVPVP
jgi:RHS repeat-associated protein